MTLPDFRNLGVVLRILVIAEGANLVALVLRSPAGFRSLMDVSESNLMFESSLLCIVLVLALCSRYLRAVPYRVGVWLVVCVASSVAMILDLGLRSLLAVPAAEATLKSSFVAGLLAGLILAYFNWRQCALFPSVAESRLIALQSRIRPHFLFNCLNTAVSLIRQDPSLAERVLLDMAELFRALVAERRSLVPLADEIKLAKSYLEIEQIRLGARLKVHWDFPEVQPLVLMPLLVLQPLLENAVRYGVEPSEAGGDITVRGTLKGKRLEIEVRNSICPLSKATPPGNRMALANIEERLSLHYDAEGTIATFSGPESFWVRLNLPVSHDRH